MFDLDQNRKLLAGHCARTPIKRPPGGGALAWMLHNEQAMNLVLTPLLCPPPGDAPLEIVERKGPGHPDTLCDALVENLGRALSNAYLERCGAILHHNVDKALLVGGAARPAFGGGAVLTPIEIHLAGRATQRFGGEHFDVGALAIEATRRWLREHLRDLDVERHVRICTHIRPTSTDLSTLFARQGQAPLANDTSFGVGSAPRDTLEEVVLTTSRHLESLGARVPAAMPWVGADTKVMGVRVGDAVTLTVAAAFIDRFVSSADDYRAKKAALAQALGDVAAGRVRGPLEVRVNAADGETPESLYLTVTGLSAEAGDDGQVGRGNRVSGLITPYRPMSLEAAAGKNPVTHVGKLYNVLAELIAEDVVREVPGVRAATCTLVSQIGRPIDDPHAAEVAVRAEDAAAVEAMAPRIEAIVKTRLGEISGLWRGFVAGQYPLW